MPKVDLDEQLRRHRSKPLTEEEQQKVQALEAYDDKVRSAQYETYARHHPNVVNRYVETLGDTYAVEKEARIGVANLFGIPSLDFATGGIPSGVVELYGEQSVGKTTLLAAVMAHAQRCQFEVFLTPSEDFDPGYMAHLGVDLEKLMVVQGDLEDLVYEWNDIVCDEGNRVLVVDSITALRPPVGSLYEDVAKWKELVRAFVKKTSEMMRESNCILMTSQVRTRKSADPRKSFAGGTDSASARVASLFSARFELSRENLSEESYDLVVNIIANTIRMPGLVLKLPVKKGDGVLVDVDILRAAAELGIVEKKGAWFYGPGGEKLGQGELTAAANLGPVRKAVVDKIYGVA